MIDINSLAFFWEEEAPFFNTMFLKGYTAHLLPAILTSYQPERLTFIGWDENAQHFLNFIQRIESINDDQRFGYSCVTLYSTNVF